MVEEVRDPDLLQLLHLKMFKQLDVLNFILADNYMPLVRIRKRYESVPIQNLTISGKILYCLLKHIDIYWANHLKKVQMLSFLRKKVEFIIL